MHTSPPTLPALIAGLRTALEADARGVSNLLLALLLRLLTRLEALTWPTTTRQAPAEYDENGRLRFHLRLRDSRRARVLSRGSKGRIRIPTWRARDRGARALPSRAQPQARPTTARAPPRPILT